MIHVYDTTPLILKSPSVLNKVNCNTLVPTHKNILSVFKDNPSNHWITIHIKSKFNVKIISVCSTYLIHIMLYLLNIMYIHSNLVQNLDLNTILLIPMVNQSITRINSFRCNFDRFIFVYRQKRADTNACYPEVGCFDTSGPYGYIGMVPNRPDEVINCTAPIQYYVGTSLGNIFIT